MVKLDVTDDDSVKGFAEACTDDGMDVDVVVANAGVADDWLIELTSMDRFRKVMNVNYFGVVNTCKALLSSLKNKVAGRISEFDPKPKIIEVGSMLSRIALPGGTAYSASKHAVAAFSDGLRREMKPFNVNVTIFEPGFHKTALVTESNTSFKKIWAETSLEIKKQYGGEVFFKSVTTDARNNLNMISADPKNTVNALYQAVTTNSTQSRLLVGKDNAFVFRPLSLMPLEVQDWIFSFMVSFLRRGSKAKTKQVVNVL